MHNLTAHDEVDALSCVAFGVLAFAIYARTTMLGVSPGDGGELVQIAHELGVAHPPGYPLWTLLVHCFLQLPLGGTIAWRANLSSALFAAGATGTMAYAVALFVGSTWAGIASAGLYSFSPHVWALATRAEVFALNNFLLSALLLFLIRFDVTGRHPEKAVPGAFTIGLALCNQHTSIFFAMPWAAWVIWSGRYRGVLLPGSLLRLVAAFCLGLLPYFHLYLRGGSAGVYGSWGDTSSLGGFVHHVLRRDYGSLNLAQTAVNQKVGDTSFASYAYVYFDALTKQCLGSVGISLAILGLVGAIARPEHRSITLFAIVPAFMLYLGSFFYLANLPVDDPFCLHAILERFWPQPNMLVFVAIGAGIKQLFFLPPFSGDISSVPSSDRLKTKPLFCCARCAFSLTLVFIQARTNFSDQDQSSNTVFSEFGRALLDSASEPAAEAENWASRPARSMILVSGDEFITSLRYMQRCELYRPDIAVLDMNLMTFGWHQQYSGFHHFSGISFPGTHYGESPNWLFIDRFLATNYDSWAIFLGGTFLDGSWELNYTLWPRGLLQEVSWRRMATGDCKNACFAVTCISLGCSAETIRDLGGQNSETLWCCPQHASTPIALNSICDS